MKENAQSVIQPKEKNAGKYISSALCKTILSYIREGDYQHPGEEEAIEILFSEIPKNPNALLLDVGCGRGGTAEYLQKHGWGNVIGIDIDQESLVVAQEKYGSKKIEKNSLNFSCKKLTFPTPLFFCCDAIEAETYFKKVFSQKITFDVVYLFSSFLYFTDKNFLLKNLANLAKKGTKLLIFDYVDYGHYHENRYMENELPFLHEVVFFREIENIFDNTGWKNLKIKDIDQHFIRWYTNLADLIELKKDDCIKKFGTFAYNCIATRYKHILDAHTSGLLGGKIISCEST